MRRIISGVFSAVLALIFILPASTPAFADSDHAAKVLPAFHAALAIKAPNTAEVSQPVIISVFEKHKRETIAGASVYALTTTALVTPADSDNYSTLMDRYVSLVTSRGLLLGITGDNGTVTATFTESGRFLLVAVLKGYTPGFSRISVGASTDKQLSLKAPQTATINQQVTITTLERSSGQPVETATIYAFGPNIRLTSTISHATTTDNGTATSILIDSNFADSISSDEASALLIQSANQPIQIGYTDISGQLTYSFQQQGVYTLVAFKEGYLPGGKRINILLAQGSKALEINAPLSATTGQSVYLNVWERSGKQPVAGASLYLLRIGDITTAKPPLPAVSANLSVNDGIRAIPQPMATLKANFAAEIKGHVSTGIKLMPQTAKNDKAESANFNQIPGANVSPWAGTVAALTPYGADTVKAKGQLIGSTGDNGQLAYTFSSSGRYALAAFKDGDDPAVAYINVGGTTATANATR